MELEKELEILKNKFIHDMYLYDNDDIIETWGTADPRNAVLYKFKVKSMFRVYLKTTYEHIKLEYIDYQNSMYALISYLDTSGNVKNRQSYKMNNELDDELIYVLRQIYNPYKNHNKNLNFLIWDFYLIQ